MAEGIVSQELAQRLAAELRARDEAEARSRTGGAWNTAGRLHREPTLNVDYGPPPPRMQFRSADDVAAYRETYPTAMRIPENLERRASWRASEFPRGADGPTVPKARLAGDAAFDEARRYAYPRVPPIQQRLGREDAIRDAVDLDLAEVQRQRALLQQFGTPEQRAEDIISLEAIRRARGR